MALTFFLWPIRSRKDQRRSPEEAFWGLMVSGCPWQLTGRRCPGLPARPRLTQREPADA